MRKLRERPLQVYLRPDQDSALRQLAATRKVSMAELVREGVDSVIKNAPIEEDPLLGIIGLGSSDVTDLAERHDYYIVQAIMNESKPSPKRRKPRAKGNLGGRKRMDRRKRQKR